MEKSFVLTSSRLSPSAVEGTPIASSHTPESVAASVDLVVEL